MKLRNFTPHPVNMYNQDGTEIVLSISCEEGQVRVSESVETAESINGFPVVRKVYGSVEGLPESAEGVINIVSVIVLTALAGMRSDVVCPDTGKDSCIRGAKGKILGVKRFQR